MKLEAYNGQFLTFWETSLVPVDSLAVRSLRKCYRLHIIGAVRLPSTRENPTFLKSNLCDVASIPTVEEDPNFIPKYDSVEVSQNASCSIKSFDDLDDHVMKQSPRFWEEARKNEQLVNAFPYLKMFYHYPCDVPLPKSKRLPEEKKLPWMVRLDIIDNDGKVRSINFFTNFTTIYNHSKALKPYVDRHIKFNMGKILT